MPAVQYKLQQENGSYLLQEDNSFILLNLANNYLLDIGPTTFTVTGFNAQLTKILHLVTVVGSFTLTGFNMTLQRLYFMGIGVGKFTVTGFNLVIIAPILHTIWTLKVVASTVWTWLNSGD
jgi:hypothetical protein